MTLALGSKCKKPGCTCTVQGFGVRFCDECLTPNIEQEYKEFQELLKSGYDRQEAAVAVGWIISTQSVLSMVG